MARACAALLSSEGVWGAAGTQVQGRWVRVSPQLFSVRGQADLLAWVELQGARGLEGYRGKCSRSLGVLRGRARLRLHLRAVP